MKTLLLSLWVIFLAAAGAANPRSDIVFESTDGDPKKPETMEFQITMRGRQMPALFLKLGAAIPGTDYVLESFAQTIARDPATGIEAEKSELTLQNVRTKETLVLPLPQPRNFPVAPAH